MNVLKELVAEWYEYCGYFVRRSVKVRRLKRGGYEGELDVIAFNPKTGEVLHIETSMGARSWEVPERDLRRSLGWARNIYQNCSHLPNRNLSK